MNSAPPDPACEPDARRLTRINLRPIASPLPLGFYTVAIASALGACLQLGAFAPADRGAVGLTIVPAFVLQLLVSVLAFGARDVLAATVMGCFAGHWLANSLVLAATPPGGSSVLGVLNLVFAVFAVLMATVMGPRRAVWLVLVAAVPWFVLSGTHEIVRAGWLGACAGAAGLVLALVALYTAYAMMLEELRGEDVLPVGRHGQAHTAVRGDLTDQLRDMERQAGVRRTL
ncbi:GPR1/FUN34/YaaH family transporter [Streptomyces chengbuensis]|uniref:GPR1/FUN34/YaaH family transporter n=1 Tax=Streptomyces TaxID=1883 RepID=UPI0025B59A58|nr:GPR1/FUN34/YaaH family transporter [Streptomyces sp. HUAS CB01]WJY54195.1 GPR1/FUN34/YaaH family transporter [Streptomyces sp. HUAS CB01]